MPLPFDPHAAVSSLSLKESNPFDSDNDMEVEADLMTEKGADWDGKRKNIDAMCYSLALLTNILQHDNNCAELVGKSCE